MSAEAAAARGGAPARRWAFVHPFAEAGGLELPLALDPSSLAEGLMALSGALALDADGVWLEVGGSAALFEPGPSRGGGGEEILAGRARAIALALGLEAKVAVADRPATARLLARAGSTPISLVPPGGDGEALAPLPLEVVGVTPMALAYLERLGVRTLGALRPLSPVSLGRRLGPEGERLVRLARAEELPLPGRFVPPEQPVARLELEPPLPPGEPVLFVVKRLLDELEVRLSGRGLAVAALRLTLALEGGGSRLEELLLPRPMRSTRPLLAILRERLWNRHEDLVAAEESPFEVAAESRITAVEVRALRTAAAPAAQPSLLEPRREAAAEDLHALLARLAATLGGEAVHGAALVPTHRPERAWRPADLGPLAATDPARRSSRPSRRREMHAVALPRDPVNPLELVEPPSPRPLFLLPEPLAVSGELEPGSRLEWEGDRAVVHRAWGPERLRGEWWVEPFARDYYVVDLEDGERVWIYRDGLGGQLYLHGIFD